MTQVAPTSAVARFLFSQHLKKGRKLRPNAFEPPDDLKMSVCVRDGLSDIDAQQWGVDHASRDGVPPKGFASLHVINLLAERLRVERDDIPPRHANVVGWPSDDAERLNISQAIRATVKPEDLYLPNLTTTSSADSGAE
jgi:hypothetical protein